MFLLIFDHAEFFFEVWFFVRAVFGMSFTHTLFEFDRIADLAFVFFQRLELGLPDIRDVNRNVGLVGERNPNFVRHMRRVAFLQQFGKEQIVAGGGEDGIQDNLPSSAMIGMVEAVGGEQILGIACDQDIGFHLADDAHHVSAQINVRDQRAIIPVQEVNCFNAQRGGSGLLFFVTQVAQFIPRDVGVVIVATFVTTS